MERGIDATKGNREREGLVDRLSNRKISILEVKVDKESKPCESCGFEPECRYAHDFEVEECKDWRAREEDEE